MKKKETIRKICNGNVILIANCGKKELFDNKHYFVYKIICRNKERYVGLSKIPSRRVQIAWHENMHNLKNDFNEWIVRATLYETKEFAQIAEFLEIYSCMMIGLPLRNKQKSIKCTFNNDKEYYRDYARFRRNSQLPSRIRFIEEKTANV